MAADHDVPPARSLVVPMFREAHRIDETVARLAASSLADTGTEMLFVDDGSPDGTAEVTERALARTGLAGRVLRLPHNVGKGGAVQAGMLAAHGDVVAFADADLAAGPDEIMRCLAAVGADADVVIATRGAGSVITQPQPAPRQFAGKTFNALLRMLGLTDFRDTQCGLKAFSRPAAQALFPALRTTGFAFDVELLLRARALGFRIRELPIVWQHVEESRVRPLADGISMALDALRLRWRLARDTAPARGGRMQPDSIDAMVRVEDEHWWWRAKRALVAEWIDRVPAARGCAVDAGCGGGAMLSTLAQLGFRPVLGTDKDTRAARAAAARCPAHGGVVVADVETLPVRTASVACLTALDVVEHVDDDVGLLGEYARVLAPGGVLVVLVPAHDWAWSEHDVRLGHRRRYTRPRLASALASAGFRVERLTHVHAWLVPLALLVRRTPLRRWLAGRGGEEDGSAGGPLVSRMLFAMARMERRVLRHLSLPIGLSLLAVARAPGGEPAMVRRSPVRLVDHPPGRYQAGVTTHGSSRAGVPGMVTETRGRSTKTSDRGSRAAAAAYLPGTSDKPGISATFPCHDEEANVGAVIEDLLDVLERVAAPYEIIVSDDGSRDATAEIAERYAARHPDVVRVVRASRQHGYGHALAAGLRAARFEWVFSTDGDRQFIMDELERLLPYLADHDVVTGYRAQRRDPLHRRAAAYGWNLLGRRLFGIRVTDVNCAFRLFRRSFLEATPLHATGATIGIELHAEAMRAGLRVAEVAVTHRPRTAGRASGGDPRVALRALAELATLYRRLGRS